MKGSIRFITGLLVTLGCVGGLETNPDVSALTYLLISGLGLFIMYSGVKALNENRTDAI